MRLPQREPRPHAPAPAPVVPRASSVALARQAARDPAGLEPAVAGSGSSRRARRSLRPYVRPLVSVLAVAPLLLGSFDTTTVQAARNDVSPARADVLSAEGDPTPSPDPSPSPSPTPKPTPRPTPWPTPAGIKGLDVSHWNGYPDFDRLRDEGMRFVFSKASQGTTITDDTFKRHTKEARAAGLLAGAYHFFDYRKGGKAQARYFLDTVRSTTGLSALLPLVVDVETLTSLGTPDKAKARQRLHGLIDELYRQTGRYPMIYTSRHMWNQVVGGATSFGRYPLWVACWKCDTIWLPNGWSSWDFWQVGQFKFKDGPKLDGNVWRSSLSELYRVRQRDMRIDDGAEWASAKAVQADLRGYDGVEVRYAAAGAEWGPWRPYSKRFDLILGDKQGLQGVKVQLRNHRAVQSLVVRDTIRLDTVPPRVWGPRVRLRQGVRVQRSGARVPTVIDMGASDATSGLASTGLKATCGGKDRASAYGLASKPSLTVQIDKRGCTLVGQADDAVGHRATRKLSPNVTLVDLRRSASAVTFGKGWTILSADGSLGRTIARTRSKDATVKVRINGAQFAVVARRGPAGGKLKVFVDGRHADTIDLYARDGDPRRIVHVQDVPRGAHTVKLRATGTGRAASGGSTVWLDALLVLDRRK